MIRYFVFVVLLLQIISAIDIIPDFKPIGIRKFSNGTNFTSILIRENSIYVGAKDFLYKFDAANIANVNSPNFAYSYLPANNEQKEQCMLTYYDENLCNNFIKSILDRQTDGDLYVCGSYAFTPRLFQLSYDLTLIKEDDGYGYCSLNPLDSSTSIWIDQGNPLNIPSLYSGALLDASTKTQPVEPVIYRPELKRSDKSYPYLRTPKFDSDWLYQPSFIASFEVDEYVLFFLKEKSIEQIAENQDLYYSRVIRVCKNDAGSANLGNQWSSMRKTRLSCIYNNTYLNNLEDIIRVNEDAFIGVFSLRLPTHSVSFLCEFKKQDLLSTLNTNSFKEVVPGTQYWSKLTPDKIPKELPSQCDYNSQLMKDDVTNFIKSHPLVSEPVEGNFLNYINTQVNKIAVDVIRTADNMKINVYYLGTYDGKIIKLVDYLNNNNLVEVSQWSVASEPIEEMEIKQGRFIYIATSTAVYQVPLVQCSRYSLCSSCMTDPYCGFNIRKTTCEDVKSNANLVSMNSNLCSRLYNKNENLKPIQAETESNVNLECGLDDAYLASFIEWRKDKVPINLHKNSNFVLTASKDLVILSGNSSLNGVYNCVVDNEIISSYSITFKSGSSKTQLSNGVSQQCITAESYIRQYNNWCDELSRYQRALNEWEDLKDKTCGAPNDRH